MEPKYIAAGGVTPVRLLCVAVAILVLAAVPIETFQITASALPTRLERYLTDTVKVAPDERTRLAAGEPITKLLDADESKGSSAARGVTATVSSHRPAANGAGRARAC